MSSSRELITARARIALLQKKIAADPANSAALGRWAHRAASQKVKNQRKATELARVAANIHDDDVKLHEVHVRVVAAKKLDALKFQAQELEEQLTNTRKRIEETEAIIRTSTPDVAPGLLKAIGASRDKWAKKDAAKWLVPNGEDGRPSMTLCPLATRKLYWRQSIMSGHGRQDPNRDRTQYKPERFFLVAREYGWTECKTEEAARREQCAQDHAVYLARTAALGGCRR